MYIGSIKQIVNFVEILFSNRTLGGTTPLT